MELATRFSTGDRVTYRDDGGQGTVTTVWLSPPAETVTYTVEWDDGLDNGDYHSYQLNQGLQS